jgi:hypothetical protein
VAQLKKHPPEDDDGDVMAINATGHGAEVLVRAWGSEQGKNAIVRRGGGLCCACARRAASNIEGWPEFRYLDLGVLSSLVDVTLPHV